MPACAGASHRPVRAHDGPFSGSMSCTFRVKYGFTFAAILVRFPILANLFEDMEGATMGGAAPPVTYQRLVEITRFIYDLYGLPASAVMPILR